MTEGERESLSRVWMLHRLPPYMVAMSFVMTDRSLKRPCSVIEITDIATVNGILYLQCYYVLCSYFVKNIVKMSL